MDNTVKQLTALAGVVGIAFSVFFYMNKIHAPAESIIETRRAILETELRVRAKDLERDINQNAKIRHHYDQKAVEEGLSHADESRLKYVEEELERQYAEKRDLEREMEALNAHPD